MRLVLRRRLAGLFNQMHLALAVVFKRKHAYLYLPTDDLDTNAPYMSHIEIYIFVSASHLHHLCAPAIQA